MAKNVIIGQSGGPTAVINSSLAGVYKAACSLGADKVYGMKYGIEGLLKEELVELNVLLDDRLSIELLKRTPSSYLGSCRYKLADPDVDDTDYKRILEIFKKYDVRYFFYNGGNDSMDTCNKVSKYMRKSGYECRVMGIPKTIDNDLWGTDMTFGFQSAVDIATDAIDCIHTTAASHGRVFIVEVMGHKVGWLTLNAGIAGGADIILIPEIPYDIDKVCKSVLKRSESGKNFSIIAVAEGCFDKEEAKLKKKERARLRAEAGVVTATNRIAAQIQQKTQLEARVCVPGHMLRGGSPSAYDRILATQFGVYAAQLIKEEHYGMTVAKVGGTITANPLAEIAGKTKFVTPDDQLVATARNLGISFGD